MTTTQMTSTGGTKRARDASQKSLRLPLEPTNKKSEQQRRRQGRIPKPAPTSDLSISKHSGRNRKRTKLSRLRDNRHIHRAVAAMEEQLASFEKTQHQPDFTSTSFSASSSFFFDVGSISQRDESSKTDGSRNTTSASDEYELAALARSLRLEESSSSSDKKPKHRRRGAISIVMSPRR